MERSNHQNSDQHQGLESIDLVLQFVVGSVLSQRGSSHASNHSTLDHSSRDDKVADEQEHHEDRVDIEGVRVPIGDEKVP
jgi:hypothetical protein